MLIGIVDKISAEKTSLNALIAAGVTGSDQ